ncbi:hypothetical protein BO94DRAFT_71589 [Aspergillus sclerotioniger CBS 115572]|uniref:Alpha and gamma adaptin binding protein p34 n=1 Tax=Aspergillus sclerotioniger CBS 115572 TaxID=1450535 RepID=A0A317WLF4_9EURO|nr:hypothetical protein BO94DRAFT_71589 [Aspergillus sclerotioniger CBS 115572]PWY87223.1 hypothetical protein BO94DRAFT_71589 [Aspergillus sclerotioniger CBS 115572]
MPPSPPSPPPPTTSKPIPNPRRLLILTPTTHSQTIIPPLLHTLTGTPVTTPPTTTTPTPPLSSSETLVPSINTTTTTTTFAGYTTHPPLHLSNKYYSADIPIWVDEIPLASTTSPTPTTSEGTTISPSQWKTEFSSPEAQVVRDAIGAVMICLKNPVYNPSLGANEGVDVDVEDRPEVRSLKDFVQAVGDVRALIEEERGLGEVPGLVVLVGEEAGGSSANGNGKGEEEEGMEELEIDEPFSVGWWEDQVCEMGLMGMEVVRWDGSGKGEDEGRNRYGELQGMRRIKEVLETHDWAATEDGEPGLLDDGFDDELERELLGLDDETETGFGLEVDELQREMVGLRMAIERGGGDGFDDGDEEDEELRVDAVEALLLRMRAIKDMSDELPETERKRFAAKAVRDIMKEL